MITREESLLYQDGLKAKEAELKPIIKEKDKKIKEKEKILKELQKKIEKLEQK